MPATLPIGGLTFASVLLTGIVVGNAYYQKKQFYSSVVYITKSNPSLAAIYFLAFTCVILIGKLLKNIFFGTLRAAEFEQLLERSFYAVTETCLAFTVFRDDFSPKFVSLFTVLLFLKAFHYLTDSRVDFMERSPVITMVFHIRATSLLFLLMLSDLLLLNHSYLSTIIYGASVQLVFGFEYAILLTVGFNIAVKYICHSIDLRSENPWENKAVYLLYTELLVGFVKVLLYFIFLFIMIRIHTFPLFIIRPMYLTLRSFKNALNAVIQSRRAIHNMNTLYPDASQEELSAVDNVCIICREEMTIGAKKLPCGHIFHSACLRSWFQRQQTCPTCRMDILQQPALSLLNQQQPGAAAPAAPAQQQPIRQDDTLLQQQQRTDVRPPQPMANPFMLIGQNMPQGIRPQFPFPMPFNNQMQPQQPQSATTASSTTASNSTTSGSTSSTTSTSTTGTSVPKPGFPMGAMPPFFPFMPFNIPCPTIPPNFEGLTIDELRKMEGNEREAVEARIKALRDIQTLLDAASIQLSQYHSVVSSNEVNFPLPKQEESCSTDTDSNLTKRDTSEWSTISDESSTSSSPVKFEGAATKVPELSEKSEDLSDEANEIRKRRLEKFSTAGGIDGPPKSPTDTGSS